jgi:hypothetical protein
VSAAEADSPVAANPAAFSGAAVFPAAASETAAASAEEAPAASEEEVPEAVSVCSETSAVFEVFEVFEPQPVRISPAHREAVRNELKSVRALFLKLFLSVIFIPHLFLSGDDRQGLLRQKAASERHS